MCLCKSFVLTSVISFFPSIKTLYVGIPGFGSFTEEQVDLFQRRYEEGFNLYTDLCYVNWLEIHHPEALPNDRYDLNPADDCVQSVASHYANVSPANAVPSTPGPIPGSEVSSSANDLNAADDCVQSVASHFANISPLCPANAVFSTPGATLGPSPGSEASNSAAKAASSKDSSRDASVVSKYLKVPIESTPQRDKRCLPHAKLFTSLESLRILEGKEKKKQEELEMKAKRKKEREEKKTLRDEEF